MIPFPPNPEPSPLKVIVVFDGDKIIFADYADENTLRQIVQIIQKRKFITH